MACSYKGALRGRLEQEGLHLTPQPVRDFSEVLALRGVALMVRDPGIWSFESFGSKSTPAFDEKELGYLE